MRETTPMKKIETVDDTASNEHIAKIAALPRGISFCVFLRSLLALIKCWKAATSAICHYVRGYGGTGSSRTTNYKL